MQSKNAASSFINMLQISPVPLFPLKEHAFALDESAPLFAFGAGSKQF
jgi:hypothetical protein